MIRHYINWCNMLGIDRSERRVGQTWDRFVAHMEYVSKAIR